MELVTLFANKLHTLERPSETSLIYIRNEEGDSANCMMGRGDTIIDNVFYE